ncbi:MAG: hypothetical protein Phog2KO_19660 [Phototrophicaceae bacterium]
MLKRFFLFSLSLLFVFVPTNQAQNYDFSNYSLNMNSMISTLVDLRFNNAGSGGFFEAIGNSGDTLYIAPLIDVAYFAFGITEAEVEIYGALETLTGEPPIRAWATYLEWASENDIALPPDYDLFKSNLLSTLIDPDFAPFFENVQATAQINMVEVVWGGVSVDGIPSLVNARQLSPEEALAQGEALTQFCADGDCSYPQRDEFVFGVEIDGDARAYPLRQMNWHEMFNDVIGHTALYDVPNGTQVCNFRAPTVFQVIARDGDDWVQINGVSAGCIEQGWVSSQDLEWVNADWETVRDDLPDISQNETALNVENGIDGRVSGRPVMLAYCTLCGAGILYDVTIPDLTYTDTEGNLIEAGETVLEFGSTGMLMRSNKLMYDRNTNTVWNAFTGIPAFGDLATSGIELPLLPVVVTTWSDWLEDHPDTSVLSLETGFARNYTNGAAYSDYFNDSNFIMFPSFQQNTDTVQNKEMIFGLIISDTPRAYPLTILVDEPVVNDTLDDLEIVIISEASPERDFFEPGGAAVRAYERAGLTFSLDDNGVLVDDMGNTWQLTEDTLIAEDGRRLERIAGHLAFWFGWYGFYPETDLYAVIVE